MKVHVTLRYLTSSLVVRTSELEISDGITAGDLTKQVIREEEEAQNIEFSGASIVTLVNRRIAAPDTVLQDGDEIKIMPVAAAG